MEAVRTQITIHLQLRQQNTERSPRNTYTLATGRLSYRYCTHTRTTPLPPVSVTERTVAYAERKFTTSVATSHQHAHQAVLGVMHGLERRMPLFVELDEFHRSCVIDPDLSNEKVNMSRKTVYQNRRGGEGKREGSTTHKCTQVTTLIHVVRSGENLTTNTNSTQVGYDSVLRKMEQRACAYGDAQPVVLDSIPI